VSCQSLGTELSPPAVGSLLNESPSLVIGPLANGTKKITTNAKAIPAFFMLPAPIGNHCDRTTYYQNIKK
jgi:hypothetical protein